MAANPRQALRRLLGAPSDVEEICEAHEVVLLVAFGSVARDEPDPADLDLAFAVRPGARGDLLSLFGALSRVADTEQLDLLDLDRAGVVARQRALTQCVPIFEAEPGEFAERQIAAILAFAETRWLRELQLQDLRAR